MARSWKPMDVERRIPRYTLPAFLAALRLVMGYQRERAQGEDLIEQEEGEEIA